jgi:16S rRNA (guanine527-N7)-methyltransferase
MTSGGAEAPFLGDLTSPEALAAALPISRETLDRLKLYAALLEQWQRTINLVAPRSIPDLWLRHIADSAQIEPLAPPGGHWVDFGAGAGFPGLVVAILRAGKAKADLLDLGVAGASPDAAVTLVESDARKCAFLAEVVRRTGLKALIPVEILNLRIESAATRAKLGRVNIVSARAVAALDEVLALSAPLFGPSTVGLFPKGRNAAAEIEAAKANWTFTAVLHRSRTERDAAVVEIRELQPRSGQ